MLHRYFLIELAILVLALIAYSASPNAAEERSSSLSRQELRANCPGLTHTIAASIQRIKELQVKAKAEQAAAPTTVWNALQRTFGPRGAGISALHEMAKERKRADLINAALLQKGCSTVSIDERLRDPAVKPK